MSYAITADSIREQTNHYRQNFKKLVLEGIVYQCQRGFNTANFNADYMTSEVEEELTKRGFTIHPGMYGAKQVRW